MHPFSVAWVLQRIIAVPMPRVIFCNKLFLRWEVLSLSRNPQTGGPLLFGCTRLLMQYIRNYYSHLEAVSSIRDPRMRHAMEDDTLHV